MGKFVPAVHIALVWIITPAPVCGGVRHDGRDGSVPNDRLSHIAVSDVSGQGSAIFDHVGRLEDDFAGNEVAIDRLRRVGNALVGDLLVERVLQGPAPPSGAASPATPTVAPRSIMHQEQYRTTWLGGQAMAMSTCANGAQRRGNPLAFQGQASEQEPFRNFKANCDVSAERWTGNETFPGRGVP